MLPILHIAVPICHCFGACFEKERCNLYEKLDRHQNKWSQAGFSFNLCLAFIIFEGKLGSCEKSLNWFFIAKMCHSAVPVLTFGAAEAGQRSVCLEYWYTCEVLKPWAEKPAVSCTCMNKTKSPALLTSRGNFTCLHRLSGHLTCKGTHPTTGNKISSQLSKRTIANKTC